MASTPDDVRRHGLQWPPNRLQIFEVVVVSSSLLLFVTVCVPLLSNPLRHVIGSLYGLSVIMLICTAGYTARCNPSAKEEKLTEASSKSSSKLQLCYTCNIVKQFRTEHCSFCNRCTAGFDHHCIWLNNCIGGANYHAFAATLVMVLLMTSIVVGTCLGLIAVGRMERDSIPKALTIVSMVILIGLNFPLLVLDINLMAFHIGIARKSMTTMEYLRACNSWEKQQALQDVTGSSAFLTSGDKGPSFRPFPLLCDWVIFRRRAKLKSRAKVAAKPMPATAGQHSSLAKLPVGPELSSTSVSTAASGLRTSASALASEKIDPPESSRQDASQNSHLAELPLDPGRTSALLAASGLRISASTPAAEQICPPEMMLTSAKSPRDGGVSERFEDAHGKQDIVVAADCTHDPPQETHQQESTVQDASAEASLIARGVAEAT